MNNLYSDILRFLYYPDHDVINDVINILLSDENSNTQMKILYDLIYNNDIQPM
jgi:hypothetical protein